MSDNPQANGETPEPAIAAAAPAAAPAMTPEASAATAAAAPENGGASSPFPDIGAPAGGEPPAAPAPAPPRQPTPRLDLVLDLPVKLSVELGRTEIPIRDVVGLGRGSVVELDRAIGEPMDVRVNGILIGRGEIVVVNEERLGLRFTEVVSQADRARGLG